MTTSDAKRYYWLKLPDDFFRQKEIKQLRKIAGGDTFTIIYLKMLLRSLKDNGKLFYEGFEDNFASELALDIDEDEENVKVTVAFLMARGILVQCSDEEYELISAGMMTGSEGHSAERVRRLREKRKVVAFMPEPKAKTNAERQRAFRAKQNCEKQHIPLIDDHTNAKRYNGNYYLVMQRDRYKCAICDSTENLCVHHIDGYSEDNLEHSNLNKMLTLCRRCHAQVHASSLEIPQDVLDAIKYDDDSNVTCNAPVTLCNEEKRKERDRDREREEQILSSFDRFWKTYPRKVNKTTAVKAWKSLKPNDSTVEEIIADVTRRLRKEWRGKDMTYIPHPSTYLNQRRWEDETEVTEIARPTEPTNEDILASLSPEELAAIDAINARGENFG